MFSCARFLAAALFLIVLVWAVAAATVTPLLARHEDTEEELLPRIQRERNPVRKAKYEIRLGRIKLLQAIDGYDKGTLEQGQQLLAAYTERVKSSWKTLRSSGRQAVRQPQGYKELDIALREDARLLEDLKHRVSYNERGPVEKAAQEVEAIRSEVLRALFPAERPLGAGSNLRGARRPHGPTEKVLG